MLARPTRRDFLTTAAAGAAGLLLRRSGTLPRRKTRRDGSIFTIM